MQESLLEDLKRRNPINSLRVVPKDEIKFTPLFDSVFDRICLHNTEETRFDLFLGALSSVLDYEVLRSNGIKTVLSITGKKIDNFEGIDYHTFDIEDDPQSNLMEILPEAMKVISEGLEVGSVLVHCNMGVSRSGAVVIAYVALHDNIDFQQALETVQSCRLCVSPNDGFREQLQLFLASARV